MSHCGVGARRVQYAKQCISYSHPATLPWRQRCRKASQNPHAGVSFSVQPPQAPPQQRWSPCLASRALPHRRQTFRRPGRRLKKAVVTACRNTSSATTKPPGSDPPPFSFLRRTACFSQKNPTRSTVNRRTARVLRVLCKACHAACPVRCRPWTAARFCGAPGWASV